MNQIRNKAEAFAFSLLAGAAIVVVMAAFGILVGALTK